MEEIMLQDSREAFNAWFGRYLNDKGELTLELTVGDIWEAWNAAIEHANGNSIRGTYEGLDEKNKLRCWRQLTAEEKNGLAVTKIVTARWIKTNTINRLQESGINNFAKLMQCTKVDILRLRGISCVGMENIVIELEKRGYRLMPSYLDER